MAEEKISISVENQMEKIREELIEMRDLMRIISARLGRIDEILKIALRESENRGNSQIGTRSLRQRSVRRKPPLEGETYYEELVNRAMNLSSFDVRSELMLLDTDSLEKLSRSIGLVGAGRKSSRASMIETIAQRVSESVAIRRGPVQ